MDISARPTLPSAGIGIRALSSIGRHISPTKIKFVEPTSNLVNRESSLDSIPPRYCSPNEQYTTAVNGVLAAADTDLSARDVPTELNQECRSRLRLKSCLSEVGPYATLGPNHTENTATVGRSSGTSRTVSAVEAVSRVQDQLAEVEVQSDVDTLLGKAHIASESHAPLTSSRWLRCTSGWPRQRALSYRNEQQVSQVELGTALQQIHVQSLQKDGCVGRHNVDLLCGNQQKDRQCERRGWCCQTDDQKLKQTRILHGQEMATSDVMQRESILKETHCTQNGGQQTRSFEAVPRQSPRFSNLGCGGEPFALLSAMARSCSSSDRCIDVVSTITSGNRGDASACNLDTMNRYLESNRTHNEPRHTNHNAETAKNTPEMNGSNCNTTAPNMEGLKANCDSNWTSGSVGRVGNIFCSTTTGEKSKDNRDGYVHITAASRNCVSPRLLDICSNASECYVDAKRIVKSADSEKTGLSGCRLKCDSALKVHMKCTQKTGERNERIRLQQHHEQQREDHGMLQRQIPKLNLCEPWVQVHPEPDQQDKSRQFCTEEQRRSLWNQFRPHQQHAHVQEIENSQRNPKYLQEDLDSKITPVLIRQSRNSSATLLNPSQLVLGMHPYDTSDATNSLAAPSFATKEQSPVPANGSATQPSTRTKVMANGTGSFVPSSGLNTRNPPNGCVASTSTPCGAVRSVYFSDHRGGSTVNSGIHRARISQDPKHVAHRGATSSQHEQPIVFPEIQEHMRGAIQWPQQCYNDGCAPQPEQVLQRQQQFQHVLQQVPREQSLQARGTAWITRRQGAKALHARHMSRARAQEFDPIKSLDRFSLVDTGSRGESMYTSSPSSSCTVHEGNVSSRCGNIQNGENDYCGEIDDTSSISIGRRCVGSEPHGGGSDSHSFDSSGSRNNSSNLCIQRKTDSRKDTTKPDWDSASNWRRLYAQQNQHQVLPKPSKFDRCTVEPVSGQCSTARNHQLDTNKTPTNIEDHHRTKETEGTSVIIEQGNREQQQNIADSINCDRLRLDLNEDDLDILDALSAHGDSEPIRASSEVANTCNGGSGANDAQGIPDQSHRFHGNIATTMIRDSKTMTTDGMPTSNIDGSSGAESTAIKCSDIKMEGTAKETSTVRVVLEDEVCVICSEMLSQQPSIASLPNCRHLFCFPCIFRWATISNRCPLCKSCFAHIFKRRVGNGSAYANCKETSVSGMPATSAAAFVVGRLATVSGPDAAASTSALTTTSKLVKGCDAKSKGATTIVFAALRRKSRPSNENKLIQDHLRDPSCQHSIEMDFKSGDTNNNSKRVFVDLELAEIVPIPSPSSRRRAALERGGRVDGSDNDDVISLSFDGCEVCGADEDWARLLLCDSCDKCFHIYCLTPPLSSVPRNSWFCGACVASRQTRRPRQGRRRNVRRRQSRQLPRQRREQQRGLNRRRRPSDATNREDQTRSEQEPTRCPKRSRTRHAGSIPFSLAVHESPCSHSTSSSNVRTRRCRTSVVEDVSRDSTRNTDRNLRRSRRVRNYSSSSTSSDDTNTNNYMCNGNSDARIQRSRLRRPNTSVADHVEVGIFPRSGNNNQETVSENSSYEASFIDDSEYVDYQRNSSGGSSLERNDMHRDNSNSSSSGSSDSADDSSSSSSTDSDNDSGNGSDGCSNEDGSDSGNASEYNRARRRRLRSVADSKTTCVNTRRRTRNCKNGGNLTIRSISGVNCSRGCSADSGGERHNCTSCNGNNDRNSDACYNRPRTRDLANETSQREIGRMARSMKNAIGNSSTCNDSGNVEKQTRYNASISTCSDDNSNSVCSTAVAVSHRQQTKKHTGDKSRRQYVEVERKQQRQQQLVQLQLRRRQQLQNHRQQQFRQQPQGHTSRVVYNSADKSTDKPRPATSTPIGGMQTSLSRYFSRETNFGSTSCSSASAENRRSASASNTNGSVVSTVEDSSGKNGCRTRSDIPLGVNSNSEIRSSSGNDLNRGDNSSSSSNSYADGNSNNNQCCTGIVSIDLSKEDTMRRGVGRLGCVGFGRRAAQHSDAVSSLDYLTVTSEWHQ